MLGRALGRVNLSGLGYYLGRLPPLAVRGIDENALGDTVDAGAGGTAGPASAGAAGADVRKQISFVVSK